MGSRRQGTTRERIGSVYSAKTQRLTPRKGPQQAAPENGAAWWEIERALNRTGMQWKITHTHTHVLSPSTRPLLE